MMRDPMMKGTGKPLELKHPIDGGEARRPPQQTEPIRTIRRIQFPGQDLGALERAMRRLPDI